MAPRRKAPPPSLLHPTRAEFMGLCAACALALSWCETNGALVADDMKALAAVRAFNAGSLPEAELRTVGWTVGTVKVDTLYSSAPDHPVVLAHASAREAILCLLGVATKGQVDADTWRGWRHQFVTLAGTVGTHLRVLGADHQIQVAASAAESVAESAAAVPERKGAIVPGSPEAAWQLALGEVLALLRERQKLTREDVVVRANASGPPEPVTAAQLARMEGGSAGVRAPVAAVAAALGSSAADVERLADRATALAAKFSEMIVGIRGERWYADAIAAYGDRFGRAILCTAAAAALKPET